MALGQVDAELLSDRNRFAFKAARDKCLPVSHLLNVKERLSGVVQVSNAPCRGYEEWQGENAEVERSSTDRCSSKN